MKRLNLTTIALGLFILTGCDKKFTSSKNELSADGALKNKTTTLAVCRPDMYNLAVDSVTGNSYINKVTGSPSAGPISVTPYVVSVDNQLKTCSGTPILHATGLAYDPATGKFYGTTGAAGSPANAILEFTDPNCVTVTSATSTCGITLDLSDVERDPASNVYYAINRGTGSNNRIVTLDPATSSISCLPNAIPVGLKMRGLTFKCDGQLWVMVTGSGTSASLVPINKTTGANGLPTGYVAPIAPSSAVMTPEIGLHFDCACTGKFITGNYNPFLLPKYMTDYIIGSGTVVSGVLPPTVDFARPY